MFKMEMKFNGKKITSSGQLEREFKKSINNHVENEIHRVAGAGTKVRKTRNGILVEGTPQQIERMRKRLI